MIDWGDGRYETTAQDIEPGAQALVQHADPQPGEQVLDVGCGTGNATRLVARTGATVLGIDPAVRLIEVARERLAGEGLTATFDTGDATNLDLPDDAFDLVISVFGVIFAAPPEQAAAELARVTKPGGRIVVSAWLPTGVIFQAGRLTRQALNEVTEASTTPAPLDWAKAEDLARMFPGAQIDIAERQIAFTSSSPGAQVQEFEDDHPVWRAAKAALPAERWDRLKREMTQVLTDGNEDPSAYRSTSDYVIVSVVPPTS